MTAWEHEGVFTIVKCNECGLVYLNPRPKKSELGKYYPIASYWGTDVDRAQSYGFLYRLILAQKKTGRILDIGAGTGMFLSYFAEQGWRTDGVEYSKGAVQYAQKKFNLKLKKGDFLDFHFPRHTYDVITLNNVLEHLYEPVETLTEVYKTLKKDGILVITVPNSKSLGFTLFGKNWYALQPPRHVTHFSDTTLTQMLESAGFRVKTISHWYWIHNFASIFESFRLSMSPRFAKKSTGGLVVAQPKTTFSLTKEVGKRVFTLLSALLAVVGSLLGRGESICICAIKR